MTIAELEYKEAKLRDAFKLKLALLDVDGYNDATDVHCVKTYGILWHITHQLLKAEKEESNNYVEADTINMSSTGFKMLTKANV